MPETMTPEARRVERKQAQSKGGKTRSARMSPAERSQAAKKASQGRWKPLHAIYEGTLELRGITIPSAHLDDGTRILSQTEFMLAMGKDGRRDAPSVDLDIIVHKLPVFLAANNLEPFISSEIRARSKPIEYRNKAGEETWGYDATFLADVCDVYLDAQEAGALRSNQDHIAKRCQQLNRGFARIGIIALVDEATGYQRARDMKELRDKLNELLAPELQPYTRLFPTDFYEHMFRLNGWAWNKLNPAHGPRQAANYTLDVVYDRITPGLLSELRKKQPDTQDPDYYLHRGLSDKGRDELLDHIKGMVMIMRTRPTPHSKKEATMVWRSFIRMIDRSHPKQGQQLQLPGAVALHEEDVGM